VTTAVHTVQDWYTRSGEKRPTLGLVPTPTRAATARLYNDPKTEGEAVEKLFSTGNISSTTIYSIGDRYLEVAGVDELGAASRDTLSSKIQ